MYKNEQLEAACEKMPKQQTIGEMMGTTKNILLELNERLNEMYFVLYGARYSEVKDVEANSMTEAMENIGRLADMAICNTMAIRNCL